MGNEWIASREENVGAVVADLSAMAQRADEEDQSQQPTSDPAADAVPTGGRPVRPPHGPPGSTGAATSGSGARGGPAVGVVPGRKARTGSVGLAISTSSQLVACEISEDDFEKLQVIGSGQFGKVLVVKKIDTQRFYAMKIMKKADILQRRSLRHIRTEKILLAGVDHPFVIRCHWAFQNDTKIFMIMDFVNGGELFYHLSQCRRFPEARTRLYGAELFLALKYLHSNKIIHRDLKLENILLGGDGHIILTDFGLSKILEKRDQLSQTLCGTVTYVSPEMIAVSKKRRRGYGWAVDWWAFGVLLFEMMCGFSPFHGNGVREIYQNILTQRVTFPRRPRISREAKDLIRGLLRKRPRRRLGSHSPDEIQDHPWFEDIDWDLLMQKQIPPVYVPNVSGPGDTKFISKEFLDMELHSLKVPVTPDMLRRYKEAFTDFSFAKDEPED